MKVLQTVVEILEIDILNARHKTPLKGIESPVISLIRLKGKLQYRLVIIFFVTLENAVSNFSFKTEIDVLTDFMDSARPLNPYNLYPLYAQSSMVSKKKVAKIMSYAGIKSSVDWQPYSIVMAENKLDEAITNIISD